MIDPEGRALLGAVLAAPGDVGARLVLADWLCERNDPRGELIQLQCAGTPEALERSEALLAKHGARWLGPLRPYLEKVVWRRGFVEEAVADAATWLVGAEFLASLTPLRHLTLTGVTSALVPRLAAAAPLARIPSLDLSGGRLGAADAARLAASPHLAGCTSLVMADHRLGPEGAAALVASPHLRPRRLGLDGNALGDRGARALAEAPALRRLTRLYLRGNDIGPAGAAALAASPHLHRLKLLDLRLNRVGEPGAHLLRRLPRLVTLEV